MPKPTTLRRPGKLLLTACLALGFTAAPFEVLKDFSLDTASALAKGGNGGGHGGGNGGGNGNAGGSDGPGNSAAAPGHNKSGYDTANAKSDLGSLNASNASPTARANASRNSRVGMLGEYEKALANGDLDAAAAALAGAANKAITPDVVAEVNRNMGIESTSEEEAQIAEKAEAARTGQPADEETETADGSTDEENVAEDGTGDDPAAMQNGEIAAAAEDLINAQ